jgi:hypothetical protein
MPPQDEYVDGFEVFAFWLGIVTFTGFALFLAVITSPLVFIFWVALMAIFFTGKMLLALRKPERITDPFPDLAE